MATLEQSEKPAAVASLRIASAMQLLQATIVIAWKNH